MSDEKDDGMVVLDSTDPAGLIAHATGQPAPKPETKPEAKPGSEEVDENGLTAEQREGLTRKMQRQVGKKHAQLKDAEEFAAAQMTEARAAKARADALEKRLADLEAKQASPAPDKPAGPPQQPRRDNFETEEAYSAAWYKWQEEIVAFRVAEQLEKDREKAARAQTEQSIKTRLAAAQEAMGEDWEDKMAALNAGGAFKPHVATYLQESDLMGEMLVYLADNPEERERIEALHPARAIVALGKIESKLTPFASGSKEPAKASNGAKPSTSGKQPKTAIQAEPSETDQESEPESRAPVITPSPTDSVPQVQGVDPAGIRAEIELWKKRHPDGSNLLKRKRH